MNKKGFLLVDSLITVIVVSISCYLCMYTYKLIDNYEKGYLNYKERINESYFEIFNNLGKCEKCEIEQEDSSPLEA